MKRGLIAVALALIMIFAVLAAFGCNRTENGEEDTVETSTEQTEYDNPDKYVGEYSAVNGTFGGVDDLGRVLSIDGGENGKDRKVGIFYFLWQGEHGTGGPYDNYKIATENPDAV